VRLSTAQGSERYCRYGIFRTMRETAEYKKRKNVVIKYLNRNQLRVGVDACSNIHWRHLSSLYSPPRLTNNPESKDEQYKDDILYPLPFHEQVGGKRNIAVLKSVLGIRDILVRIRRMVLLTNGSGSGSDLFLQLPYFKDSKKIIFFIFFSYNLPADSLSSVLKI
jgi:hypothetical protein